MDRLIPAPASAIAVFVTSLGLLADVTHSATARFAIIGDYGVDNADQLGVANFIKTNLQPQFIVTAGDNNYGTAAEIDSCIGKYYHTYIGDYRGTYGSGAVSNRFFPALGNHDYLENGYGAHTNYFTLPGNERYYEFVRGPVHFFVCNSEVHEPDGTTSGSVQARNVSNWMARATAPWRIVIIHDPPYSSTESITASRWPFKQWGAHAVVSGDSHQYERLEVDGVHYYVNGSGGAGLGSFGTPRSDSKARYSADHGAMLVTADETILTLRFYSVANGGTLIDSLTLVQPRLAIRPAGSNLRLSWTTNGSNFILEHKGDLSMSSTWGAETAAPSREGTEFVVYVSRTPASRYYRLKKP